MIGARVWRFKIGSIILPLKFEFYRPRIDTDSI